MLDRLLDGLEAQAVTLGDLPDDLVARYRAADGRALLELVPAADLRDEVARARFVDAVQAVSPQVSGVPATIVAARPAVVLPFAHALHPPFCPFLLLLLFLRPSPPHPPPSLAPPPS